MVSSSFNRIKREIKVNTDQSIVNVNFVFMIILHFDKKCKVFHKNTQNTLDLIYLMEY